MICSFPYQMYSKSSQENRKHLYSRETGLKLMALSFLQKLSGREILGAPLCVTDKS